MESYRHGANTREEVVERKGVRAITFFYGSESRGMSVEVSVMEMER